MKNLLVLFISSLFFNFSISDVQSRILTGNVINVQGNPVKATVSAGNLRVNTDAKGNYEIKTGNETFLYFTAAGYQPENVRIGNQAVYNVVLKRTNSTTEIPTAANLLKLEEAIVQSQKYDSKNRALLIGSLSSVMRHTGPEYKQYINTEEYDRINENGFKKVSDDPLSTFSIDVDAASYSNVRRFIQNGQLPPAGAVRTEELINYFDYDYPQPGGKEPFTISTVLSKNPWNNNNQLLLIGMQGKIIPTENLPPSNLVFLIDVSGSMSGENRLPLVKKSLELLTDQLREKDVISIVVYAGNTSVELNATSGQNKKAIKEAIQKLQAEGSTAGGAGLQLAYKMATKNFMKNGNNRVILCTDGDFNVGPGSNDELIRLIEKEREKGVFLTVLGYGMGNYKDSKMQLLADKGNGNHAYIDGLNEAKKVLVTEFGGTLFTLAKDVKIQIEFNPEKVAGYRLIGYENRLLNKEDFKEDKKDAGELGSGQTVTALYEIVPAGVSSPYLKDLDPLKYQKSKPVVTNAFGNELLTLKARYKTPKGAKSNLLVQAVKDEFVPFEKAGDNFQFAVSVAGFGMLLTESEFKGKLDFEMVRHLASGGLGRDEKGYRKEFLALVKSAGDFTQAKGN